MKYFLKKIKFFIIHTIIKLTKITCKTNRSHSNQIIDYLRIIKKNCFCHTFIYILFFEANGIPNKTCVKSAEDKTIINLRLVIEDICF
jgi:hypothetical protein